MTEPVIAVGPQCPFCHQPQRMGSRYCGYCGLMVAGSRTCASCQTAVPGDYRYCDLCGRAIDATHAVDPADAGNSAPHEPARLSRTPVPAARTAPPAPAHEPGERTQAEERRLATVMFADVSGFTTMSESMDPEEVKDVMNEVFKHLSRIIEQSGGVIDKYIGDCIMAVFGAPHSYGDDAERAVRAALKMQAALDHLAARLEPRVGTRLRMRIGMNTGLVSAGRVGEGSNRYTVMGDTVNLANRMESNSTVGRVLISCNTQRFVADRFILEDAGRIKVKGKSQPIQAFFVVRERLGRVEDWAFQLEGIPIPFISRAREISLLDHVFANALEERSVHAAVVSAASGLGKTRLIAEFCRRAQSEHPDMQVLREREGNVQVIHSRATVATSRMEPIARTLREILGGDAAQFGEAIGQTLEKGIAASGEDVDQAVRRRAGKVLMDLLDETEEADPTQADAESRLRFLLWSIKKLFQGLSHRGPLLMIVSDYHLADEITLALMRHLVEASHRDLPMMVVLETHPGEGDGEWRPREREDHAVVHLTIPPLTEPEVLELLAGLLGPCGHVPGWVSTWVLGQCGGVPFYVVEMVRSLIAMGIMRHDDETGRWMIDDQPPADLKLPPTIHGALQAVVDHLPPVQRSLLCVASHIGDVFWDEVLAGLVGDRATPDEVRAALNHLRTMGMVRRRQNSLIEGAVEYRFASEMVFRTCYEMLPLKQRREIYHGCAERLETLGLRHDNPALVARHWDAAGERGRALALYLDAFEKDLRASSLHAAGEMLARCDAIVAGADGHAKGDGAKDERRVAGRDARARLELCRATFQRRVGKLNDALASAARGLAVLDAGDQRVDGDHDVVADHALRRLLHTQTGLVHHALGNHQDALDGFNRALAHARDGRADITVITNLAASRCWSLVQLGRRDEAETETRETLLRYTPDLITDVELCDAVARHLDTLGEIHKRRKELDAAAECYDKARALRERQGNVRLLSVSDNNIAVVRAMKGDWPSARDCFARVLASRKTHGDPYDIAVATLNLAESHLTLGEEDPGATRLIEGSKIARTLGAKALLEEVAALSAKHGVRLEG